MKPFRRKPKIMCAACRGTGWVWAPGKRDLLAHKVKCATCHGKGWRKP